MNKLIWNTELNGECWAKYDRYVFIITQEENFGYWIVTVNGKTLNKKDKLDEAKRIAEIFVEKM